jgi:hypothetical protein
MVGSWGLAVAWTFAAYGVWGGLAAYPLGVPNGCSDAIHQTALNERVEIAVLAAMLLAASAILTAVGTRQPRTEAARLAMWLSLGLLLVSFVPFVNFFALIGVPYVLGLSIWAGTQRPVVIRWISVVALCAVASPVVSYWIDASECL